MGKHFPSCRKIISGPIRDWHHQLPICLLESSSQVCEWRTMGSPISELQEKGIESLWELSNYKFLVHLLLWGYGHRWIRLMDLSLLGTPWYLEWCWRERGYVESPVEQEKMGRGQRQTKQTHQSSSFRSGQTVWVVSRILKQNWPHSLSSYRTGQASQSSHICFCQNNKPKPKPGWVQQHSVWMQKWYSRHCTRVQPAKAERGGCRQTTCIWEECWEQKWSFPGKITPIGSPTPNC